MSIWALPKSLQINCSVSKAQSLKLWSPVDLERMCRLESILSEHGEHCVAVVAMQMVRDVRGTLTAPSPHSSCLGNWAEMQKRPPPAERGPLPRLFGLHTVPRHRGPWRPIASCASFHDTVIHAEGRPPGAWLLKEHPCGSGIMWVCCFNQALSRRCLTLPDLRHSNPQQ